MTKFGEELGFNSIWMQEEHFIPPGGQSVCLSPQVLGAAIASQTQKIRIGFSVLLLPLHSPLRCAEEIATLDAISRGRVEFGVSRGFPGRYFDAFGATPESHTLQFRKSLGFILDCWTDHEKMINRKKYRVEPKPVQKPHPPVYVATYTEDVARWAARSGYGLIQHGMQSKSHLKKILRAFESAGGKVGSVPVSRFVYVGRDDSSARKEIRPTIQKLTTFLQSIKISRHGFITEPDLEPDKFIEEMVIVGGPKTVLEEILTLRESFGIEYLNSLIAFYGNLQFEAMIKSLKLMSKKVMPGIAD
jgi:alkanesulfonate monooxygenase SsuD/methylene tetrahydromethanopterin reductase-like flavin-dependent oxidoreductase (luciferase family)